MYSDSISADENSQSNNNYLNNAIGTQFIQPLQQEAMPIFSELFDESNKSENISIAVDTDMHLSPNQSKKLTIIILGGLT